MSNAPDTRPDAAAGTDAAVQRALARFPDIARDDPALLGRLARVALASDFAIGVLLRQPDVLLRLAADDGAEAAAMPSLTADNHSQWPVLLRRHRTAESARLVWRDVLGLDDVDTTLAASTRLAEDCLQVALGALETEFAQRHGSVRDADGRAVRLVVFGLGKLGGGELNFSSDVDLVYGYEGGGDSRADDGAADGAAVRSLAAETYFARLGQQLAKLLDDTTADGFCHRVDLRLRPFGNAGRVAMSFASMEHYFQRDGRDWERYAWQKARVVAGDVAAGDAFLATLRPFVYRRYLDFGALDGLRTMKAAIAADVARKELGDDIKRGPGGIREIEFLAQALQLIHGGRSPALRERRLLPSLHALCDVQLIASSAHDVLVAAYRFLRRLENRVQMLRDAQVHALPDDPVDLLRVARGLGFDDAASLRVALDVHRAAVAEEFAALLAARADAPDAGDLAGYWRALPARGEPQVLADAGFDDAAAADAALREFARGSGVRELSDGARSRLDRVLPAMLQAAGASADPLLVLRRLLQLLHNVLRRASYLALLDEQPAALARLVDAVVRSAFLAERVATLPMLMDELLDARVGGPLPSRAGVSADCRAARRFDDIEPALLTLNEVRQALSFRIALATLDGRQPALDSARQLAWLAEAVVDTVLALATREMLHAHGAIDGARFAAIGYGSLGGAELGFGSDLDLVFLYDAPADAQSSGGAASRALDAPRWFARLAQKIVSLLGAVTAAGRLYDTDVRLRPDGGSGLLVSTLASYDDYQHRRAWTWEHQALVRARCVTGDPSLCADFERVRDATLGRTRDVQALRADVASMRLRMRSELDRSNARGFDLKQGEAGLVDLEFLLQYLVLRDAASCAALLAPRDTPGLIDALTVAGAFDASTRTALRAAHASLLAAGLSCTLDRRRRWVVEDAAIAVARSAVRAAVLAQDLRFG